eukprot:6130467-Alexandrium_andersonii.AAC.1
MSAVRAYSPGFAVPECERPGGRRDPEWRSGPSVSGRLRGGRVSLPTRALRQPSSCTSACLLRAIAAG